MTIFLIRQAAITTIVCALVAAAAAVIICGHPWWSLLFVFVMYGVGNSGETK